MTSTAFPSGSSTKRARPSSLARVSNETSSSGPTSMISKTTQVCSFFVLHLQSPDGGKPGRARGEEGVGEEGEEDRGGKE